MGHPVPGSFGQRSHLHEPLPGDIGFGRGIAPVAVPHIVHVAFLLLQKVLVLEVFHHLFAAFNALQPGIGFPGFRAHPAFGIDDLQQVQAMLPAQLEIVHVVGRRDLEAPGAEFPVHIGIRDNGDSSACQRKLHIFSHQVGVPLVFRVHRHRSIAEHGLRPGGGHDHIPAAVAQWVTDVVESSLDLLEVHFQVGQGGPAAGAPVDDVVAPVDEPLFEKPDENFTHRPGQPFVHGKTHPGPVHGSAHALNLVEDLPPVLLLPLPDLFDEFVPPQILSALALCGQSPLHHVLGGNAGMVHTRNPKDLVPFLPVVAAQNILQGEIQGMAHMQTAGDVRGRNDNGVRFSRSIRIRGEGFLLLPVVDPFLFNVLWFVSLGECGLTHGLSPVGALWHQ